MSGVQFVETLRHLSYPGVENVSPQGLDWMFENEAVLPFLEWFCSNISSSNLLDLNSILKFQELSPEGVLEGPQLEEAVQNVTAAQDDSASEDTLKADIQNLSKDEDKCEKRKRNMVNKRNKLSLHYTALRHRIAKMSELESSVKSNYRKCLEQTQVDSNKLSRTMEKISQSVSSLHSMYEDTPSPNPLDLTSLFLSQLELDSYYEADDKYTQELTSYTKKQFFDGIAEMSGQIEGTRYEILEISDPESLLIRGEREVINGNDHRDLARLQKLFPKSESIRINAKINSCRASQLMNQTESLLQSLLLKNFAKETSELSQRIQETNSALHAVRRDLAVLAEKEVPVLIQESAGAQVVPILTGDYNLKLARQDYFTSNQDKIINYLVEQRAKNEFLTMAYEVELRGHRDMHRLLTAVRLQLQSHIKSWNERMAAMDDSTLTPARHNRSTLDTRDKAVARLHEILVAEDALSSDRHRLFHTYTELIEGGEKCHQNSLSINTTLFALKNRYEERVQILEHNIKNCQETIYAGSSTTSGQPSLTPFQIKESMMQLEDMLRKLEQSIMYIRKELDSKKKTLKNEIILARERKFLTYFFINPNKLQESIDEISSRLQAERL